MNILVTGGAGYIGSHTIIELLNQGYKSIYSIDNYINSDESNYSKIEEITGESITYLNLDLKNVDSLRSFFKEYRIETVIHFAALKSVPDSVQNPELYYDNNLFSLINLLTCIKEFGVKQLIFSSSCSIYGNPEVLPVNEQTPFGIAESPYATTKQMGEMILRDFSKINPQVKIISLRYFNPLGAHKSGLIGEAFTKRPNNLLPIITQTAAGLRTELTVFGSDYNTNDGSCIRDYIHVVDVATAHVKAINYLSTMVGENFDVINLGTGTGTSVLEMIHSFEKVSGVKLNYILGERRVGDVETIYADNSKAKKLLKWNAEFNIDDMVDSAWKWQQNMKI